MSKVCSYSFFRSEFSGMESENAGAARGKFYLNYLPCLVRAHMAVWAPDYELWIYHDDRVTEFPYFTALKRMEETGILKLIPFGKSETLCGKGGMLERLNPVFDWNVDVLVIRDIDGLPMPRDRRMVEEFLAQDATAHVIHDSISHIGTGFLGGTCAFDGKKFRKRFEAKSLLELMDRVEGMNINYKRHGADQMFLASYVAPNLWGEIVHHTMGPHSYNGAKRIFQVADRPCEQDRLMNHVGGAGDAERAKAWYDEHIPNAIILKAEEGIL